MGASATLAELADTIQARLAALREVEAERAKPRVVVRQVTAITLVALGAALLLQPGFFAPYRSPIGQLVMVAQVLTYVLSLLALRRMTIPRRRERILQRYQGAAVPGGVSCSPTTAAASAKPGCSNVTPSCPRMSSRWPTI